MPVLDYKSSEQAFANPVNVRLEQMKRNLNEMVFESGKPYSNYKPLNMMSYNDPE